MNKNHKIKIRIFLVVFTFMLSSQSALSAEIIQGEQEETGLVFWEWQHEGVTIRLAQRLPDQTRAFFLGRGFTAEAADIIGENCVFQTIFRNESKQPLDYKLSDWQVTYDTGSHPPRIQDFWKQKWLDLGLTKAAQIAFQWSFLPPEQHFEPGDYNWGMTSYGLAPGELFDLKLVISINGQNISGTIPGIQCPTNNKFLQGN